MLDPYDDTQGVSVDPPLGDTMVGIVGGLAGVGDGPRRVWPGQPGVRSPWLPCASGCCLVLEPHAGDDPATWLRFLIREVLAPRAAAPAARARELGLTGMHRVDGAVLLDLDGRRPRAVVVSGNRVRVIDLDEDLFPVEPERQRRGPGEVVPLERSVSGKAGRRDTRPVSAPRSPPS